MACRNKVKQTVDFYQMALLRLYGFQIMENTGSLIECIIVKHANTMWTVYLYFFPAINKIVSTDVSKYTFS